MAYLEFQLGTEACLGVSPEQVEWGAHVPSARIRELCSDGQRRHRAGRIENVGWVGLGGTQVT